MIAYSVVGKHKLRKQNEKVQLSSVGHGYAWQVRVQEILFLDIDQFIYCCCCSLAIAIIKIFLTVDCTLGSLDFFLCLIVLV